MSSRSSRHRVRWSSLAILALLLPRSGAARVALPDARELESNDGTYRLRVSCEPEEVPLNERFRVRFTVERIDGEPAAPEVEVDARMPGHGHGMNRDAIVERRADGGYTATNLLFHMPGYWELYFDVTEGAVTERAQVSIELE